MYLSSQSWRCHLLYSLFIVWALETHAAMASRMDEEDSSNNTVLIGGLFSVRSNEDGVCGMISSGPFANVEAMIFAVDNVNNNSDILPNVTLKFNIRDTCGLTNTALEEAVSLMEIHRTDVGLSGIVGPALSDVSISVASLLRVFQIPQISHSSTATVLSNRQRFDYFFRTIPPDSFQARAMADLIVHFNWTYIIGIYTDDTYGRGGIRALREELSQRNYSGKRICVLEQGGVTAVPLNAEKSHYAKLVKYITQSWNQNSTVAVLFGQRKTAQDLFGYMESANITLDHLTWIASDAWATRVNTSHQHLVEGMLGVVPQVLHVPHFDEYFASLKPSHDSANPWLNESWEDSFHCKLEGTVNRCPSSLSFNHTDDSTGNGVAYVLEAVYTFAYAIHDLISDLCPNSTGLLCPAVTVERFGGRVLNGTLIREYIYRVTVPGPSAVNITYNRTTGGDQPGFYEIINLGIGRQRTVGTWNASHGLHFTDGIEWRQGIEGVPLSICSQPCGAGEAQQFVEGQSDCCHRCEACIGDNIIGNGKRCEKCELGTMPNHEKDKCVLNPVTFMRWSSPWAILIFIGTTLGLAATAFVAVVFVTFNKRKIIKATSRELSAILLTGIALCYILPFFFIADPSPATCAIRRFSIGFCFSLCFSPLLMKTNRIYRVFHTAPQTPRFAGPWSQVVFTCVLVAVQVLIAALWLGLERPSVRFVNSTTTTEKVCGASPYIGLPVSLIYSLLILVLTTFYAFLAREIPANFNETKFIAITLYSICIIWLGFFPTYFATIKLGTVYQTSTLVFAVLLSASTTLACLFFPKVILLFITLVKEKRSEQEKQQTMTTTTDFGISDIGSSTYSLRSDKNDNNFTL